jgi:hypothetical protein
MQLGVFRAECIDRGMNVNTFYQYLSYSPIITRFAREVYALVGSEIAPGEVEGVQRAPSPQSVIVDNGWTKDGRPWISYRLNTANLRTGVFTIPLGYRELIVGEYFAQASGTGSRDKISAKDGRLTGLRRSTAIRGGEEGDVLTFAFDLRARNVEIGFTEESFVSADSRPTETPSAFGPPVAALPTGRNPTSGQTADENVIISEWQPISTVPPNRNVEVQVADALGRYALLFPCRLDPEIGWFNAWLSTRLTFEPVEWREWTEKARDFG